MITRHGHKHYHFSYVHCNGNGFQAHMTGHNALHGLQAFNNVIDEIQYLQYLAS